MSVHERHIWPIYNPLCRLSSFAGTWGWFFKLALTPVTALISECFSRDYCLPVLLLMACLLFQETATAENFPLNDQFAAESQAENHSDDASSKNQITVESTLEELRDLNEGINKLFNEGKKLQISFENLGEEDRLVVEKRIIDIKLEYVANLARQVEIFHKLDRLGYRETSVRENIEDHLNDLSAGLLTNLSQVRENLTRLRKAKESAPVDKRADFDRQVMVQETWLIQLYDVFLSHINQLQSMGMEWQSKQKFIKERISRKAEIDYARLELIVSEYDDFVEQNQSLQLTPEIQAQKDVLDLQREDAITILRETVRIMGTLELDTSRYQKLIITSSGKVTADLFKPSVAKGLIQEWTENAGEWISRNAGEILVNIITFIFIILAFRVLALIVSKLIKRALANVSMSNLLQMMIVSLSRNLVMAFGVLVALSQLGVQVAPILAGLGIVGFIIGFALQDSLSNFASGMMIIGYRPFDIGDFVEAGGVKGIVENMTLVSTTIKTFDNQTLVVPNSKIWGNVIRNMTDQKKRRVDLEFVLNHKHSAEAILETLRAVVAANPLVEKDPEPLIHLNKVNLYGQVFIVRPWVETPEYWTLYWQLQRQIKAAIDENEFEFAKAQLASEVSQ